MRDIELYRAILGLPAPWTVSSVDLDVEGQQVIVRVEAGPGPFPCPECGAAWPRYDSRPRRWRHLDTCQFTTWIGVAAESVAVRTVEIGVRMAVGASAGHVMRLVMRQTTTPVMAGLAVGWLMAWWTTRLLQQFLFEVPPRDPLVFAASVVVLLVAAVLAAWPPARHATRLDPVAVLRAE